MDVKKALLNLGEENAKAVWLNIIRPLIEEEVVKSTNKIDDIVLPFLPKIDEALLALVDKIDGEVG